MDTPLKTPPPSLSSSLISLYTAFAIIIDQAALPLVDDGLLASPVRRVGRSFDRLPILHVQTAHLSMTETESGIKRMYKEILFHDNCLRV